MIVSEVHIYPIKSCGGIALDAAQIGTRGFLNDRRWMLIDDRGDFLTQREIARMALIRPSIASDLLTVSAPDVPDLEIPLDQPGAHLAVTVWDDSGIEAIDQGDTVADWFSGFLGRGCRLVRMADDALRPVDQRYAPRISDQVSFADGYPFLIISEESLADLNAHLADPLPMNRFRPNIVVQGADEAFAEDMWGAIEINGVIFDLVKPCGRCAITTTDQETAARGKEPLRTLAQYRPGKKGAPQFGQNAVHRSSGVIPVGAEVEVLEYRYD